MIGAGADNEAGSMPIRRETAILFALSLLSGTALGPPLSLFPPVLARPIASTALMVCAVVGVALVGHSLWERRR
jgi:hypothetical protein